MVRRLAVLSLISLAIAIAFSSTGDHSAMADTVANGNDFYKVYMEDATSADGIGTYTAATGASHPVGEDLNVLYNGDAADAWSSYNTIRSYTTNTDYVQTTDAPTSANTVVNMDDYATVMAIGTTGWRVTYDLPGPPTTPDALEIVFDINVNGTTFDDSTVELTTTVTNNGSEPVDVGIRYELDFEIAGDDGPTFAEVNPTTAPRVTETTYAPPAFQAYRIEDNPGGGPTLSIFGTSSAFPGITPTASVPDVLQYVSWPDSEDFAFEYSETGQDVASPGGSIDDSGVLYFFGATAGDAFTLAPSASATVSESLFATPPVGEQEEICDNGIDDDGDTLVDTDDPDCPLPTPTPTPMPTPTATPTPEAATPTATPTAAPAELPETGSDPGSGGMALPIAGVIGALLAAAGTVGVLAAVRRYS